MEAAFEVHVSALARLLEDAARIQPTHVLSLVDPELPRIALGSAAQPEAHRTLRFRDTLTPSEPGGCTPEQLRELLAFLEATLEVAAARPVRLLVHCHQGLSRSPAAAYVALALHLGAGQEREAFARLRGIAPFAWPNQLLVAQADAALGRGGALLGPLLGFQGGA